MSRSFYSDGNNKTLDLICDLITNDMSNTKESFDNKKDKKVESYECVDILSSATGEEKTYSSISITSSDLKNIGKLEVTSTKNGWVNFCEKENCQSSNQSISLPERFGIDLEDFSIRKSILESVFRKNDFFLLRKKTKNELRIIYLKAIEKELVLKKKVSLRFLLAYILLTNEKGFQLKSIYTSLESLGLSVENSPNFKGRVRFSLTAYSQFSYYKEGKGTGYWTFKI